MSMSTPVYCLAMALALDEKLAARRCGPDPRDLQAVFREAGPKQLRTAFGRPIFDRPGSAMARLASTSMISGAALRTQGFPAGKPGIPGLCPWNCSIHSGISVDVPAMTVNRVCGWSY